MEAPGAFDRDVDCDLHLEASDGLPDDTWKLGSVGSSSKHKLEVVVRSSSDGKINIKRKVHDRGPINARSQPIATEESTLLRSGSKCMLAKSIFIKRRNQRQAESPRSWPDRRTIVATIKRYYGPIKAEITTTITRG